MKINFRKLKATEIDARVATISEKGCSLLLYKDARVDMNMLDETVGPENWEREHKIIGDNLYCSVSIYDSDKEMWITKQDVGTESNTEKEKGQASDSFKRACFNWGIGRELYSAPFIWIPADKVRVEKNNMGKATTKDRFSVADIGYDENGEINRLKIQNDTRKQIVYEMGNVKPAAGLPKAEQVVLENLCNKKGLDVATTFPGGLESLTNEQYAEAVRKLKGLKDKS